VPQVTNEGTCPGQASARARRSAAREGAQVHHTLYLPTDWKPDARLPVLVEYAGNGGYRRISWAIPVTALWMAV